MFCNFCGKNFDSSEGFEEAMRGRHHLIRCEKCVYHQAEEEYDWRAQMYGRAHFPAVPEGGGRGRQMQDNQGRQKPPDGPARKSHR